MTPDREALADRLLAVYPEHRPGISMPHSPPERGMEREPAREHETGILWLYYGPVLGSVRCREPWGWRPDLDDAATAGAILESARRAWRAPRLAAHWFAGTDDLPSPYAEPGWIVDLGDGENVVAGATDYVEALILAIEAAPDEQPASGSAAG